MDETQNDDTIHIFNMPPRINRWGGGGGGGKDTVCGWSFCPFVCSQKLLTLAVAER